MAQKMIESMFDDDSEETGLSVVDQEDDGEFGLVVNIDDIPEITKVMKQEQKMALEKKRDYVRNMIDNKKVKQATNAIVSMDTIMEFLGDREKMLTILESAKTPMDLKFIAEAYERIAKQLQNLTRLDTVDGSGTSARAALAIRFGNNSGSTTTVQVGLQVDSE